MDGAILIDKPRGLTSAGVVGRIKRSFGLSRVGHAGTLDPMATGLLVILCGKATRLQSLFLNSDKSYRGVIRLGVATATDDLEGEVTEEDELRKFSSVLEDPLALKDVERAFTGRIEQVPPQFSALKVNGERSYSAARRGEHVELSSRMVEIYQLSLGVESGDRLSYTVRCSKGTYVRSLARDIGRFLGSVAALESIQRTVSGDFSLEQARRLDEVLESKLEQVLVPIEVLAEKLPRACLSQGDCQKLLYGDQSPLRGIELEQADYAPFAAIYGPDSRFRGLIEKEVSEGGDFSGVLWKIRFMR